MKRRSAVTLSLLALISSAGGCDGNSPADAGTADGDVNDAGATTTCPATDPFAEGDANGAADPLTMPAGQSRAGRLTETQLPEDPTGLALWRAGDFVLASSSGAALIIEDVGTSDLYDRYGGRPVGIARVGDARLVDAGDFNEVLFGFSTFLTATESVTVVNDGSDGNAAIIRVNGPLTRIDFAGSVLDIFGAGNDFEGWRSSMEYRLEPGADHVEVSIAVENPTARTQNATKILYGIFQSSRMPVLGPGLGFSGLAGDLPYVAFADPMERTSWSLVAPEGSALTATADISGVTVLSQPRTSVEACARRTVQLGSIALGAGVDGAQAAALRMAGQTLRTVTGRVLEADGSVAAGIHVHASVDGTYFSRTTSAEDGSFSLTVPEADVAVTAFRRGAAVSAPVTIAAGASSADVTLPAVGYLHVHSELDGSPIPARVQITPASGTLPEIPATYGEHEVTAGRLRVEFTPASGDATVPVAPGEYDVVVSHGYEYELFQQRVTVTADGTTDVTAALVHSVDTTDWMCADYHIHTTRSPDADDHAAQKLAGMVADGLELPIRSDHEFAADFQPLLESLALTPWARSIAGEEMTTWEWGHFGVFPMVVDDTQRNGHIPNIYGVLPPAAFAQVRERPEQPTLIINHPRGSGPGFGYFIVAGYDPVTGAVENSEYWDEEFGVVEVFNDSSFRQNRDGTVVDWFSLLNHGRRVFAVGSSDSHHVYSSPVGYPRTCLRLGSDAPNDVSPNDVRDATNAGHAYVSGGIYLSIEGPGGEGPGDTVASAGATVTFHVVVRAASWVDAEELEVIVDGTTHETIPLTTDDADPTIRFEGDLEVPVATGGSWVVFHASATSDLAQVHPGREPFAVSNPVFMTR